MQDRVAVQMLHALGSAPADEGHLYHHSGNPLDTV
jgi:hypothetical protein